MREGMIPLRVRPSTGALHCRVFQSQAMPGVPHYGHKVFSAIVTDGNVVNLKPTREPGHEPTVTPCRDAA